MKYFVLDACENGIARLIDEEENEQQLPREDLPAEAAEDHDGNPIEVAYDPNGTTAAFVFKTISDQYGKHSMIQVTPGKVTGDMSL